MMLSFFIHPQPLKHQITENKKAVLAVSMLYEKIDHRQIYVCIKNFPNC